MVNILIGNIFESDAQTLTNTVNCVGVMGKGIAEQFKKRFPEMYEDYVERCENGDVQRGRPYLYRRDEEPWVLNFPTKGHWRAVSNLSDIRRGMEHVLDKYKEWGIESLAVPPLGCGNGQLDWRVVGPTLYRYLSEMNIPVELYAPFETPDEQLDHAFLERQEITSDDIQSIRSKEEIDAGTFALAAMVAKIERQRYRHPVGRTRFQKLAYFATEAGIPTGLEFRKGSYGPYADDLKKVFGRLQNNEVLTERRQGQMLRKKPGPAFNDALELFRDQLGDWSDELNRVTDLFLRMDTQESEVAATVHFAATRLVEDDHPSEMDVLEAVQSWKQDRSFDEEEIASTIRNLNMLGWIDAEFSPELMDDELFGTEDDEEPQPKVSG
ncbi:hypothetical protein BSZ35_02465 [Salinibacter sp. 10B]|uniref:type II toxin-antitoxin system antitoxin DNA ADP-ribosyl glycohydrolase DarG n=1 Tax=Salinibacter sp. 10B TaxID=1923971 RepID=UPI000CF36CDE|nr:macro domain-containing protein [Salinibacter sp. 10B]PQJ33613.1 hypothetical protein BSZ35_02465 [Salinibacter sp. 10B]